MKTLSLTTKLKAKRAMLKTKVYHQIQIATSTLRVHQLFVSSMIAEYFLETNSRLLWFHSTQPHLHWRFHVEMRKAIFIFILVSYRRYRYSSAYSYLLVFFHILFKTSNYLIFTDTDEWRMEENASKSGVSDSASATKQKTLILIPSFWEWKVGTKSPT